MTDTPELIPCPFCGSEAKYCADADPEYVHDCHYITCPNCKLFANFDVIGETLEESMDLDARAWSTRTAPEWISVDDRLPEFEKQVLVYLSATWSQLEVDREICNVLTAAIDESGNWYDFQEDKNINEELTEVTHWMQLPDKP